MQLSIIIPVYNVENYIASCLESILSQRQDAINYEVILVDDGTPDNSMLVVERYLDKFAHATVIHQKNKGLSGARNTGLKKAQGEYVWFVDSDDTIEKGIFEKFISIFSKEHYDIYGFDVKDIRTDGTEQIIYPFVNSKFKKELVSVPMRGVDMGRKIASGMAPKNLFRRQFLLDNELFFMEGVIHEDMEQMVRAKCLAETIMLYDIVSYVYLRREGSIMTTLNMKSVYSWQAIINNWIDFSKKLKWYSNKSFLIHYHIFNGACSLLTMDKQIRNSDYNQFYKEYRWYYSFLGIKNGLLGLRFFSKKDLVKYVFLIINPKLILRLK